MSENPEKTEPPEPEASGETKPRQSIVAMALERRGVRIFLILGAIMLVLIVALRVCIGYKTQWNPHTPQHMGVRNGLYELVGRMRAQIVAGEPTDVAFRAHARRLLERSALREFSIYLSGEIVEHGPDSQMPRITPLRFVGEGAPSAALGTGPDDFQVLAARRTGEDEALVWAMSARREIIFREFEFQRPGLE